MWAMGSILLAAVAAIAVVLPPAVSAQPKPVLDYGFYKSRVEPIFLAKKDGHARCVVCHADSNNNFHLEKLGPGANAWTEEQSRRNFEMVAKLVNPGDPESSLLTQHPLAPEAGGHVLPLGRPPVRVEERQGLEDAGGIRQRRESALVDRV